MKRPMAPRRLLSPDEKNQMKSEIRELEAQLHSPDLIDMKGGRGVWASNPKESAAHSGVASARLSVIKRRLEEGSVEDFSKAAINKRESEIKILEEYASKTMTPKGFYHAKRADNKDYNKTLDHLVKVELSPDHQAKMMRLQNLYRSRSAAGARLNNSSESPECGSLEHLRK